MQMILTADTCARCGQPIPPGQPMKQTATVNVVRERTVTSPVRSYHLDGHCPGETASGSGFSPKEA